MTTTDFDSTAPLRPMPSPWQPADPPSLRPAPPYHMTHMIAAEPHLARRLLARLATPHSPAAALARAIAQGVDERRPVVLTGCGTSENAAFGAASILRDALGGDRAPIGAVVVEQAFELALDPPRDGIVIGITHEGGTVATNRALEAARAAGNCTAVITVSAESPAAALAEIVVATDELDASWCHTVGYVTPLLVAAAVGGHIADRRPDPERIAALLEAGAADTATAEAIAARFADASQLIVIASGTDRAAGRELAIKVEEATWLPTTYRDLETYLHGHFPAADERTALVLLLADPAARDARIERARQALSGVGVLGVRAAAILTHGAAEALADGLTPAGRIVLPEAPEVPPPVAALFATATALQLLTERLARARGTNPDLIRRDDPRYAEAGAATRR